MDITYIIIELFGWIGAILLVIGYFLIQTDRVTANNRLYMLLNILGAFALTINTIYHRAYPSVVANSIWVIVGLWGFFNIVIRGKTTAF